MILSQLTRTGFNPQRRALVALLIFSAGLSLVIVRLWYLQIVRGAYFLDQSENNHRRTVFVPPARGEITDRNGAVIARNRPSFNIELVTEDAVDPKATLRELAKLLRRDPELLISRLSNQPKRKRYEPKLIVGDVSRDEVAIVSAQRYRLPGIVVNVYPAREYLYGDLASHVVGYVREITKDQLSRPEYGGYRQGDVVGQYGVEGRWERNLQGQRGRQDVIVNAVGARIGELSYTPDQPGHIAELTIDLKLQQVADEALKGRKGALVAMDPNTGEILAMSSAPTFDPSIFTRELDPVVWQDISRGKDKKLNNRAVQGTYPPGSTFKAFMVVAGIAEGVVTPTEKIFCPGYYRFGNRSYGCHKKSGHGWVNLEEALIQSCDVYFYTLGQRLGIDRIHDWASKFGFGTLTGLRLVNEEAGIVPSIAWKRRYFRKEADKRWYPGETLSVAIGQGATTVTPLQVARGLSALVNGGKLLQPFIVKRVVSSESGVVIDETEPKVVGAVDAPKLGIEIAKKAMEGVVNSQNGTGRKAIVPGATFKVAGKTGTAQVVALEMTGKQAHFNDHAWFMAYAPADNPKLVVSIIVENAGHGGAEAAPIARKLFETYFNVNTEPLVPAPTKEGENVD